MFRWKISAEILLKDFRCIWKNSNISEYFCWNSVESLSTEFPLIFSIWTCVVCRCRQLLNHVLCAGVDSCWATCRVQVLTAVEPRVVCRCWQLLSHVLCAGVDSWWATCCVLVLTAVGPRVVFTSVVSHKWTSAKYFSMSYRCKTWHADEIWVMQPIISLDNLL